MDASPADLFFNRVVRSSTPGSGRRNLDLEKELQKRKEEQQSIRRKLGGGRLSVEIFREGDRVRVQDVKKKTWSMKGTISSAVYHEGAHYPSSYYVAADDGGEFLRNGKYIRLLEQQDGTQQESVGLQPDSGTDSLEGGEVTKEYRRPRRKVHFRENSIQADTDTDYDEERESRQV